MGSRGIRRAALVALSLLLAAPMALGEALDERAWLDVRSANFHIRSVLGEERTLELLRHLEITHRALGDGTSGALREAATPTIILAVDDHDDYVEIGAPSFTSGYFFSDLRENAILIEDAPGSPGIQVILHEYAHYLSRLTGRVRYPRWFEEGNAEYLSHSRLHAQALEFALPAERHMATLGHADWLPWAQVLETSDTAALGLDAGALFYAQSWLLVHYLRSRPDADQSLSQTLAHYSRLVSDNGAAIEAFEEAFSVEVKDLGREIQHYYRTREFTSRLLPVDTSLTGFSPRVREMTRPEAQLALARMAMRFENIDGAERWFYSLLDDAEYRAHAEAGLGRIAGIRGDLATANERFDAAINLMAWDFNIWMDYAQYWAQRVSQSRNGKERLRYSSRLIESLESALTIAEATPELNSLMGFAYLAKGNDPFEAIEFLEAAADAAPHDQASRLLLANAYLYVGRAGDALNVAEAVLRFEHEPGLVSKAARDVIERAQRDR
jgi:tetratricopeptide (TPR) repeat protein